MIDKLLLIKLNQDNQACFKKPIQSDVDNLINNATRVTCQKNPPGYTCIV